MRRLAGIAPSVRDAVARDGDLSADPVIDHHRALQEGASEQDSVRLLSAGEVDAGEGPELEDLEHGDRDPGCVEGMAARPSRAADHDEIDDRQTEGLGELHVDAALSRPGIDQRVRGVAFGRGACLGSTCVETTTSRLGPNSISEAWSGLPSGSRNAASASDMNGAEGDRGGHGHAPLGTDLADEVGPLAEAPHGLHVIGFTEFHAKKHMDAGGLVILLYRSRSRRGARGGEKGSRQAVPV